jgi:hypothetical protein
VTPLTSSDGWIGAIVAAPNNPWVLMWMKEGGNSPALPLRVPERAGARHAIFNLQPNAPVRVERVGGEVTIGGQSGAEAMVSPAGVLVLEALPSAMTGM